MLAQCIAIAEFCRPKALLRFADGNDGSPKVIHIFPIPSHDTSVRHGRVNCRKDVDFFLVEQALKLGAFQNDLIIQPRRRAKLVAAVVAPKQSDQRMLAKGGLALRDVIPAIDKDIVKAIGIGLRTEGGH